MTTQPTARIELNLEQLRLLIKSTSKTRDAELAKLQRLHKGQLRTRVKQEFDTLAETIVELENACDELVEALT